MPGAIESEGMVLLILLWEGAKVSFFMVEEEKI